MKQALRLAARGRGTTRPNPMVGAVVVAKGTVVGSGYHQRAGNPHAEIIALQRAQSRSRQATLYSTLEPCCHTDKRTPPCVPAIIASGVRRVVVAMPDPNAQVAGRGIRQLRRAGITVHVGCLNHEAAKLNEGYLHWVTTSRPFVILKAAMTLDGKIATASGESQWITGAQAREHVHQLRSQVEALAVGATTVCKDDPQLTVRLSKKHGTISCHPIRTIFDSRLRSPLTSRVFQRVTQFPTIVATTTMADQRKIEQLRTMGVQILVLPQKRTRVSLRRCLRKLGNMGITSLLVEGGSELYADFLRERLVNRLYLYVAPVLLGGQNAQSLIGGLSPKRLADKVGVSNLHLRSLGEDLLMTGDLG